ncbi:hypothetical protein CR513_16087, partial [Mucuna pruriens]
MEYDPSKEGSALILGWLFFMTVKMKIDVHSKSFSMEFGDTYVEFNIIEALKHLAEDHSTFGIDTIDGLMDKYFRLGTSGASLVSFVDILMIDEVLKTSQYVELLVADTSKLGIIGVATLINVEPDFGIRFRKADKAKFDSKGRRMAKSIHPSEAETNSRS